MRLKRKDILFGSGVYLVFDIVEILKVVDIRRRLPNQIINNRMGDYAYLMVQTYAYTGSDLYKYPDNLKHWEMCIADKSKVQFVYSRYK